MFSSGRRFSSLLLTSVLLLYVFLLSYSGGTVSVFSAETSQKNVILIGWDGVQRNHLFELLARGDLPNLSSFVGSGGVLVNVTVSDHRSDTKAGWTQILTGYRWWRTGVFNNVYWFDSIPEGYTVPERVEQQFGRNNVSTGFVIGKLGHMEVVDNTGSTTAGTYTHEAIYSNLPLQLDVVSGGARNASVVGQEALQFIENNVGTHFFAFFHFSDPDTAGHNQQSGGENSVLYEQAIVGCDYWLGQILNKLNTLNLTDKTLVYLTADHGFDEGGFGHNYAPYIFLASNDQRIARNGDQVDVAPTIYYGLGMSSVVFDPELDGFPLQVPLPEGLEERRQYVLADNVSAAKPTMTISSVGPNNLDRLVTFNASDKTLAAVLLLVDNVLKADGPWVWNRAQTVEASGSYTISTAGTSVGEHQVKILAFDEHGAYTGPVISTLNFTVAPVATPTPTLQPLPTPTPSPFSKPASTSTPSPTVPLLPSPSAESPSPSNSPSPIAQSADVNLILVAGGVVIVIFVALVIFAVVRTRSGGKT